jgi:hypothetical protein
MYNWIVSVLIKGILNWLKGLWDSFIQKQKHIEQGRKEVLDKIKEEDAKTNEAIEKLRNTDLTVDDALNELRDGYNNSRK